MELKIKKVEKLIKLWKEAESSGRRDGTFLHEYNSKGKISGLKMALAIFTKQHD